MSHTAPPQMKPTLERGVNEACETQSSRPLLAQVLDPLLELTLDRLNNSNFKRFLWRVWEVVLEIFKATVMSNAEVCGSGLQLQLTAFRQLHYSCPSAFMVISP